jgi:hypothetical protein
MPPALPPGGRQPEGFPRSTLGRPHAAKTVSLKLGLSRNVVATELTARREVVDLVLDGVTHLVGEGESDSEVGWVPDAGYRHWLYSHGAET